MASQSSYYADQLEQKTVGKTLTNHPSIIKLYEIVEDHCTIYLVMELVVFTVVRAANLDGDDYSDSSNGNEKMNDTDADDDSDNIIDMISEMVTDGAAVMNTDTVGYIVDVDNNEDNIGIQLHRRCLQTQALPGLP